MSHDDYYDYLALIESSCIKALEDNHDLFAAARDLVSDVYEHAEGGRVARKATEAMERGRTPWRCYDVLTETAAEPGPFRLRAIELLLRLEMVRARDFQNRYDAATA